MNVHSPKVLDAVLHKSVESRVAPSLERRRLRAYVTMLLVDGVLIHFSFALAALIWEGVWAQSRAMITAQVILPVFFTIALYNGTYGLRALDSWTFASRKTLIALTISAALILFVGFYTKSVDVFSRGMVTLGLALSAVLLVAIRRVVAIIIAARWGGRVSNRVVIDDGGPSFAFAGADLVSAADYNLDPSSHDPFMLDRLGTLLRNQDQVVVSCPRERRQDWAFLLKCAGVYGEIVSEPAHELGAVGVHRYDALDRTTLVVSTGPLALRARVLKRAFDVVVALGGLIVLSPLLLVIAVLIKLEDGGPGAASGAATSSSTCSSSARCARRSSTTMATVRPRAMTTASPASVPSSGAPASTSCRSSSTC